MWGSRQGRGVLDGQQLYKAVGRRGCENVEDKAFCCLRRGKVVRVVAQRDGTTEVWSAGTSGNG